MGVAIYREIKRIGKHQKATLFQATMDFCNGVEGLIFEGVKRHKHGWMGEAIMECDDGSTSIEQIAFLTCGECGGVICDIGGVWDCPNCSNCGSQNDIK